MTENDRQDLVDIDTSGPGAEVELEEEKVKEVEELKEDLYDNQVKIKELCKEGDKLESKIKKLKALSSDIRLLTN